MKLSLFIAIFQLGLVISCVAAEYSTISDAIIHQGKEWCVVAPLAPNDKMQTFLNTTCDKVVDCKEIRPGGSCYEPNTLANHASYVLNLCFRETGKCDKQIGLIAVSDPSFPPKCTYP